MCPTGAGVGQEIQDLTLHDGAYFIHNQYNNMRGVNKVILVGFVGKEPETRQVSGTTVANFSIATNESYKDSSRGGEAKEITTWHNIAAWGKLSDIVNKFVKKGTLVYIEGKIVNKTWEKDGITHYASQIRAEEVTLLSKPE